MDLFTVLSMCASLALSNNQASSLEVVSSLECSEAKIEYQSLLTNLKLSTTDREAVGRVAVAEAANQKTEGITGVVYTILNRYISGRFGESIDEVVNAKKQFEPVTRAGGDWRNLPVLSVEDQKSIDTILDLALAGYLPDLTNGGLFFQNPVIVAKREARGEVKKGLKDFGGALRVAVIGDHAWYAATTTNIIKKNPVLGVSESESSKNIFDRKIETSPNE
jgi:spore germination cell wall hydrolase CwlJ-like protein